MKLTLQGDFAKRLNVLLKNDAVLARAMAKDWLNKIEPDALYAYLLSLDAAVDMLTQALQTAPEKTLEDLQGLAEGKVPRPASKVVKAKKKAVTKEKATCSYRTLAIPMEA